MRASARRVCACTHAGWWPASVDVRICAPALTALQARLETERERDVTTATETETETSYDYVAPDEGNQRNEGSFAHPSLNYILFIGIHTPFSYTLLYGPSDDSVLTRNLPKSSSRPT